jgi:hypothetical protein
MRGRFFINGGITMLMLVFIVGSVSALGVVVKHEYYATEPGNTACVQYGVFNSGNSELSAQVSVKGSLEEIIASGTGVSVTIPSNGKPQNAVPIEVCFKMPGVNNFRSRAECEANTREYLGHVFISEVEDSEIVGSGSGAALTFASPLTVRTKCPSEESFSAVSFGSPKPKYSVFYILVMVILLVLLILLVVRRFQDSHESVARFTGKKQRR